MLHITRFIILCLTVLFVGCVSDNAQTNMKQVHFLPGCRFGGEGDEELWAKVRYVVDGRKVEWTVCVLFGCTNNSERKAEIRIVDKAGARASPTESEFRTMRHVLAQAIRADVFDDFVRCQEWMLYDFENFNRQREHKRIAMETDLKMGETNAMAEFKVINLFIKEYIDNLAENGPFPSSAHAHSVCNRILRELTK